MIIIAPFAKPLRGRTKHPKDYPWWDELVTYIQTVTLGELIVQVGTAGEHQLVDHFRRDLTIAQLSALIRECKTWVSVDSFFQHLAWDLGKPGIVLFGQSDPNIFGHPENVNLLKSRNYLRQKQFWLWEQAQQNDEAFVRPEVVTTALLALTR